MTIKTMRSALCLVVILAAALLFSCPGRTIAVLSYNVNNLFDGVDNGTEYPEFDPGRGRWNDSLFRMKMERIALAVRRSAPGGPDIIFLQEIENPDVLERLRLEGLAGAYPYAASYPAPRGATTVGILSRFPLRRVAAYQVSPWKKREPLRPVLEALALIEGRSVYLFCVHLKSKLGGKDRETEKPRLEATGVIARRVREITAAEPGAAVIVAGDFNESADEYERHGGAYQTALLRLTDHAPSAWRTESLYLTDRPDAGGVRDGAVVLFDPWLVWSGAPPGSYFFKKQWEAIDHILFSPGASGLVYSSFRVVNEPDMLRPRSGTPLAWDKEKPFQGFSDHLPVLLTFEQ